MKSKRITIFLFLVMIAAAFAVGVPMNVSAPGNGLVTEEWVALYPHGSAYDIALDSSGNVYVTGESWTWKTSYDYTTIKYDGSTGLPLWDFEGEIAVRYNGPGNRGDSATAIAIDDSSENIYVTGYSAQNSEYPYFNYDYATIAYDPDGNELWVARYDGDLKEDDYCRAMAVNPAGNIYVTGESWGGDVSEGGTSDDYATVAYDSSGNELWVKRYDGLNHYDDRATAIATDSSGNVYVTGYSRTSESSFDYVTIKYDGATGQQLWGEGEQGVRRYNGPGNRYDHAKAIAVDSLGNVYVTGLSDQNSDYPTNIDYATVAYDSSGNELWVKRFDGLLSLDDYANAIAIDSSNNIYVTGDAWMGEKLTDYVTIAYDQSGNELWVKGYDGHEFGADNARAITTDSSGNVYVTGVCGVGYIVPGPPPGDLATVAYDSDGNELWDFGDGEVAIKYNSPINGYDYGNAIAVDSLGNIFVTGFSTDELYNVFNYVTIKYSQEPEAAIDDLIEDIEEEDLPVGIEDSLTSILEAALNSLENGNEVAAIQQLEAFILMVEGLRGKKLTEEEADALIAAIQAIIDNLSGG